MELRKSYKRDRKQKKKKKKDTKLVMFNNVVSHCEQYIKKYGIV